MKPTFTGHAHFDDIGFAYAPANRTGLRWWKIPIWRVVLNKDFPLAITRPDGVRYRPDMVFSSDGGSIPYTIQNVLSMIPFINLKRDVYRKSYAIHDCAYRDHGLWVAGPDDRWTFQQLDRGTVDVILLECLEAEGANAAERAMIYAGVRAGGWVPWRNRA